jgi:hypothetical protein
MPPLSKEEYLNSIQSLKTKHDALTAKLYTILELLEQRTNPLDVNELDTKTFLSLKSQLIESVEGFAEWESRLVATLYDSKG